MEIAGIALLIIILIVLLVLVFRKPVITNDNETIYYLKEEKLKLEDELSDLRERFNDERSNLVRAEANVTAYKDKLAQQQKSIEELQQKFTLEFSNIANKILDEKSAKFTLQNQTNLDNILNPLKDIAFFPCSSERKIYTDRVWEEIEKYI